MEFSISKSAPSHWAIKAIADVCERVTSGGTPSRKNPEFFQNGSWPWVKTQELNDCWIDDTEEHITDAAVEASSAKVLPANTVLMAMYGATVGQLGILRRPMTCNQASCAMVTDERKAHFRYLYYLLLSQREQIKSLSTGAAQQNLSGMQIKQFRLPFPEVGEQRAIAHILGTLDDKIELNRRMNETLEAMARAIFKSWFVDFDPVRAKASGEPPESICRRLGLTPDLLALFPDRLVDSELGEIPEGWEIEPLTAVIEVNPTRVLRKGSLAPYLDMANMPTTSARALSIVDREFGSGMKFRNRDTLVARITPCLENGKTCFVDFLAEGQVGWGSTEYIVLRPKKQLPDEFAYFLARTDTFRNHAIANMTGTSGRQRVPATAFDGFRLVVPCEKIAREFGFFADAVIAKMRASDNESGTLSAIRDSLLPKLLSGELPVTRLEQSDEVEVA